MVLPRAKVLVADDDPMIIELEQCALAPHFDLLLARDGRAALELFQRENVEIAVLDLVMPFIDGYTLARRILALRPATRVILVSGSFTSWNTKTPDDAPDGLFACLAKPFELRRLIQLVTAASRSG